MEKEFHGSFLYFTPSENIARNDGEFYKYNRNFLQNTSENFTNIILIICIRTIYIVK